MNDLEKIEKWVKEENTPLNAHSVVSVIRLLAYIQSLKEEKQPDHPFSYSSDAAYFMALATLTDYFKSNKPLSQEAFDALTAYLKREKQPDKGEMAWEVLQELSKSTVSYKSGQHLIMQATPINSIAIANMIEEVQSKHKEKGDE